jgi:hypothetical protein
VIAPPIASLTHPPDWSLPTARAYSYSPVTSRTSGPRHRRRCPRHGVPPPARPRPSPQRPDPPVGDRPPAVCGPSAGGAPAAGPPAGRPRPPSAPGATAAAAATFGWCAACVRGIRLLARGAVGVRPWAYERMQQVTEMSENLVRQRFRLQYGAACAVATTPGASP